MVDMFPNLAVALLFLLFWSTAEGQGAEVLCVHQSSCVLPCTFKAGTDIEIHWTTGPDNVIDVHSYYKGQNQFQEQHQNYRGRTSVFEKELSTGNASLLLSDVRVQDEGKYECHVHVLSKLEQLYFATLKVNAPVLEVSLQQEAHHLLCRSEGVYPEPLVSLVPLTTALTTLNSLESGLLSVISFLNLPHEYSCNVSTSYSWRGATYRKSSLISSIGSNVTIPCSDSPPGEVKSLVWTFRNTQTILKQTGSELVYSEPWKELVALSQNKSLFLKVLTKVHAGLFSCVLTTDSETISSHTELEIKGMEPEGPSVLRCMGKCTINPVSIGAILGGVIGGAIGMVVVLALTSYWRRKMASSATLMQMLGLRLVNSKKRDEDGRNSRVRRESLTLMYLKFGAAVTQLSSDPKILT